MTVSHYKLSLSSLLVFVSLSVFAGGYQVNLQGTKQTGMGHCGVSLYQGASSLFFNPGSSMFGVNRTAFSTAFNGVDARVVYFNPTTGKSFRNKRMLGTPFSLYASIKINKYVGFGIAAYTPYGSSLSWEDNWAGRFRITDIALKTVYVQPTISFKYGPVGIGLGVMIGKGIIDLQRDLPISGVDNTTSSVHISGSDQAVGLNFGAMVELRKGFNFGISYRTEHIFRVNNGEVDFTVPDAASEQFYDQNFKSSLTAPSNLNAGFSFQPAQKVWISGEVNLIGWSAYKNLKIDFDENTEQLQDIDEKRNWRDTEVFRFGVQYQALEWLTARAGYSRDLSPVNVRYYSPETPDTDRSGYHLGASATIKKKVSLDMAFQWAEGDQLEAVHLPSGFGGAYKGRAFIYSFGISYAIN